MSVLGETIAAAGVAGVTTLVSGTVVRDSDDHLRVSTGGAIIPARWIDTIAVAEGDTVLLALSRAEVGQSSAIVLGRVTDVPRPTVGRVREIAGTAITVMLDDGTTKTGVYVGSPPPIGAHVRLFWQGHLMTVLGPVGASQETSMIAPGLGASQQKIGVALNGQTQLRAVSAGSWSPETGASPWSQSIVQGTGGGTTDSRGAWAYGEAMRTLAGVRVKAARLLVTGRSMTGVFNEPLVLNMAGHSATTLNSLPSADGPRWTAKVPHRGGAFPVWIDIPTASAQWIVDHAGGIMISDGTFGGVQGITENPASGQLWIDWTR